MKIVMSPGTIFSTRGPGLADRSKNQRDPDVQELTVPGQQLDYACMLVA